MTDPQAEMTALRILAVDDEPLNVKIIQRLLRHCGLTCEIARDGIEAVDMAEEDRFDVILMDINMPRMDGLEAAREIARKLDRKSPRVIAVTANATSLQERRCAEAGFDGFVAKPIQIATLREALEKAAKPR